MNKNTMYSRLLLVGIVISGISLIFFGQISGCKRKEPNKSDGKPVEPAAPLAPPTMEPAVNRSIPSASQALASVEINYFGKVIDPAGNAVSGAKASALTGSFNVSWTPIAETTSDAQGRFKFTGLRGRDVIVSVSHPEFYASPGDSRRFHYAHIPTSQDPLPTLSEPATFILQPKGIREPLTEIPRSRLKLPLDGQAIQFQIQERSGSAIQFSLISDSGSLGRREYRPYSWELNISIISGEILERKGPYDFIAPEDGYKDKLTYTFQPGADIRWNSSMKKSFFLKLANGEYALIYIDASAGSGQTFVKGYINPRKGSRVLEPLELDQEHLNE